MIPPPAVGGASSMSFYVVPEYGRRLGTAEAGSLLVRNIKKPAMAPPDGGAHSRWWDDQN